MLTTLDTLQTAFQKKLYQQTQPSTMQEGVYSTSSPPMNQRVEMKFWNGSHDNAIEQCPPVLVGQVQVQNG